MKPALVIGAGGHSRVVIDSALSSLAFSRFCLLDDLTPSSMSDVGDYATFIGPLSYALTDICKDNFDSALIALGDCDLRLFWYDKLKARRFKLPSIVHSSACVSTSSVLGDATLVCANSVVQPCAVIGCGAIINTSSSIDHHCIISDGVHICPGAHLAGNVRVGRSTIIGTGASVVPGVRIGSNVTVGAGAAVVSDLPDGVTAVGVPARPL